MAHDLHAQGQSTFFKLPRELRDAIYAYYTYEPEGYRYEFRTARSGAWHLSIGKCIDSSIKTTCKRTYEEIEGARLQVNTIHFYPDNYGSDAALDMSSNVLRLLRLVDYFNLAKRHILFLCAVRIQVAMNKSYEVANLARPLNPLPQCPLLRYWAASALPDWLPDLFRESVRGDGGRVRYKGILMVDSERELYNVGADTEKTLKRWIE